jgi:hypothetical protein
MGFYFLGLWLVRIGALWDCEPVESLSGFRGWKIVFST